MNIAPNDLTEVKAKSFDEIRAGMLFTTTSWWGMDGALFQVVELGSGYAFVTPCEAFPNPTWMRWPSGMSRKLDFEKAMFSDFTFYART